MLELSNYFETLLVSRLQLSGRRSCRPLLRADRWRSRQQTLSVEHTGFHRTCGCFRITLEIGSIIFIVFVCVIYSLSVFDAPMSKVTNSSSKLNIESITKWDSTHASQQWNAADADFYKCFNCGLKRCFTVALGNSSGWSIWWTAVRATSHF